MLPEAGRVLTTTAGAERIAGNVVGLEPRDSVDLEGADDEAVEVTAVRADHGPPEVAARNGPVIGFVLRGAGLPTIYVSGDNASVDVAREIASEHGPFDTTVLFVGGAEVPEAWGEGVYLTLTPETAVQVAGLMDGAAIVPIHQDGWAHFSSGADDVARAFAEAGLSERLRPVAPGGEVKLG